MLPLLLLVLGAGAIALYMASDHEKVTAEANLAHQVTAAHLTESARAHEQADQLAAQQLATQQDTARRQLAAQQAAARQRAAAHAAAADTAHKVSAQTVAQAAPMATTDRERTITALQADLTEANAAKLAAMWMFRAAAEQQPAQGQIMREHAQGTYDAAQTRIRAAEAALRKLGVNPLAIPAPTRRDIAR